MQLKGVKGLFEWNVGANKGSITFVSSVADSLIKTEEALKEECTIIIQRIGSKMNKGNGIDKKDIKLEPIYEKV